MADDDDDDEVTSRSSASSEHAAGPARKKRGLDVIGFLHEGALFLRDRNSDAVFHSERDAAGQLVPAGRWVDGQLVLDGQVVEAEEDPSAPRLSKRQKKELAMAQLVTRALPSLNFSVSDPTDHAETGIKAYRDVKFLLDAIVTTMGKSLDHVHLYDPYYCTGRVKEHLAKLGYSNVHNENVDFYGTLDAGELPKYDVLITNPPYSGDHVDRLLAFGASQSAPFLFLLPSYFLTKPCFKHYLAGDARPVFVVPKTGRYTYNAPSDDTQGLRAKRIAPFSSLWFVDLKNLRGPVLAELSRARAERVHAKLSDDATSVLCSNVDAIPIRILDDSHPRKKQEKHAPRGGRGRGGFGRGGRGWGGAFRGRGEAGRGRSRGGPRGREGAPKNQQQRVDGKQM